jgi:hypothetical protein
MPTTNTNRKILDLKRWEFCAPAPQATAAGHFIVSSRHYRQQQLLVASNAVAQLYDPSEDGWVNVTSPSLGGTFGAGGCGTAASFSTGSNTATAFLTATAGTTTSITTNQQIARDLRGYGIQFVGGTNAGKTKTIASNTIGANAIFTFADAESVAFDSSSQYRLVTPNFFVLNAGTLAFGNFKRYDFATNLWVGLSVTGLPASWGTDGKLIATPSWFDTGFKSFATGTATSGSSTTLTNSAKAWTANQWTNSQIRITAGTGAGQIRTVASNTATAITVSAAWTVTPDATSQYSLEGNDDFLYLMGNNAVTLYRYSISGNSWTTISPSGVRPAAPGAGMSGHWIHSASTAAWTSENAIQNGRYIYSLRAGGAATLVFDRYDIATNGWVQIPLAPGAETLNAGTKYVYSGDYIYIQKDATGRWLRWNVTQGAMDGWSTMLYPNSTAVVGDTAFDVTYRDGATEISYIYMILNTSNVMLRQMVI